MDGSCSVCGVILAPLDSQYPEWCKSIRALCWAGSQPVLSGLGYNDEDAIPFLLPGVPIHSRFFIRSTLDDKEASCYPFHAACWDILEDIASKDFLANRIAHIYKIFESCHYDADARALSWRHNYYLQDISDMQCSQNLAHYQLDFAAALEDNIAILANPFLPTSQPQALKISNPPEPSPHDRYLQSNKVSSTNLNEDAPTLANFRLLSLPPEVIHCIMYDLSSIDVANLLQALEQDLSYLPPKYWESKFRVHDEAGFARSICPPTYSWENWFFIIQFELSLGLFQKNLQNRKRIWRLGVDLVNLVRIIEEPGRVLSGDIDTGILTQRPCPTVTCLALKDDREGCRILTRRSVYWGNAERRLSDVTPSYVCVSNRQLVSGLTFSFYSGPSVSIGYIKGKIGHQISASSSQFLWIVASPLGIETIALNIYPHSILHNSSGVAVSKWRLDYLIGVSVGLDALRVVSIRPNFRKHEIVLDEIMWEPPYPSPIPFMLDDDIATLHNLQSKSFTPASTLYLKPKNGSLVAIKIYAQLGYCAGVMGIRFVYDTGIETLWGSEHDAACLTFFLQEGEYLIKVRVYKTGSLVCNLQFTTNFYRTSDIVPPLPIHQTVLLDCVEYKAVNGGCVVGFCGCFVNSLQQLNCFGVVATTSTDYSISTFSRQADLAHSPLDAMPLGRIKSHGEFKNHYLPDRWLQSIQASVTTAMTKYRRVGQVTGLLFRSGSNRYPELLGQLTGTGETYNLVENEWVVDLKITTTKPLSVAMVSTGLSQIESITIVTNRRRIGWGLNILQPVCDNLDSDLCKQKVSKITWEFNAIFDRVQYS